MLKQYHKTFFGEPCDKFYESNPDIENSLQFIVNIPSLRSKYLLYTIDTDTPDIEDHINTSVKSPEEKINNQYRIPERKGEVLTAETDVTLKGEKKTVWAKAVPLYDSKGNFAGAIEAVRDITEMKESRKKIV